MFGVKRRTRPAGIPVDPARVREARAAAGMSLADVAGDEVSRTMIHFIEHGRARPSKRVLELIAERTGKPVSYFVLPGVDTGRDDADDALSRQLLGAAGRARRFAAGARLSATDREAVKLIEVNLRQSAALARALETKLG